MRLVVGLPLGIALAVMPSGCTPASGAAWMPRVTVRGSVVQAERQGGDARRSRWDWRLAVAARWTFARAPSVAPRERETPEPSGELRGQVPCRVETICAWEHLAREQALRRIEMERSER